VIFPLLKLAQKQGHRIGYREDPETPEYSVVVLHHKQLGQISWHVKNEELPDWLEKTSIEWDGHTTEIKHQRLQRWIEALNEGPDWKITVGVVLAGTLVGGLYNGIGPMLSGTAAGLVCGVWLTFAHMCYRRNCIMKQKTPFLENWLDFGDVEVET
jgi:hypothetical protein